MATWKNPPQSWPMPRTPWSRWVLAPRPSPCSRRRPLHRAHCRGSTPTPPLTRLRRDLGQRTKPYRRCSNRRPPSRGRTPRPFQNLFEAWQRQRPKKLLRAFSPAGPLGPKARSRLTRRCPNPRRAGWRCNLPLGIKRVPPTRSHCLKGAAPQL